MIQFETAAEGGSLRFLADYQRVLVNAFVDIESTGFPFDPMQHEKFIADAEKVYAEYEAKLLGSKELVDFMDHHGIPREGEKAFNLNSAAQLRKFLFAPQIDKGLSLLPVKTSKTTGMPSTDRASLAEYAKAGVKFCDDLLVLRNFAKLLSSFGEPLLKYYSPITGCVHPTYFLAKIVDNSGVSGGTATGRLSCKTPNLQQLPKRDKDSRGLGLAGSDVRQSFVPFPGHVLVEIDQSQVEVRVAGQLSGDTQMGEFFRSGHDFHTQVAAKAFKQDLSHMVEVLADHSHPEHEKFKGLRSAAKATTFGLMFGMGPKKLARQSGLTEQEGEEFIEEYFQTFPQFSAWREETIEFARKNGWVTTPFGRKRIINLAGYDSEDGREERIGINTPVQSTASDITLFALSRIWEWLRGKGYGARLVGTIHDSVVLSVPEAEVNTVIPAVVSIMTRPPGLEWWLDHVPVPLGVGVDIGHNFRDMHEVDLEIAQSGAIDIAGILG
jgi:DNA polymerase-1